jgi:hypothetical protein
MAHFARINAQGLVSTVIVAEQDYIDSLDNADSWVQTSYNTFGGKHYDPETREEDGGTPLRKNFAGIGFKYDADRDAFIPPQPFASWTLNEDTCLWDCPIERPMETDEEMAAGKYYIWDEAIYQADNTQGWVLVGGGVE